MEKATVNQFHLVINNISNLHEGLVRNGYFLPFLKSSLVTEDYLMSVAHGDTWCPQCKEIKLLPCPRPPTKESLITKLLEYCTKQNIEIKIDGLHVPDKSWLINVLSSFTPFDEIFSKGIFLHLGNRS